MLLLGSRIGLVAMVAAVVGCTTIAHEAKKSPLARAQMSSDSTVLEIFFLRVGFGDPEANQSLWAEIDEQHFPPLLRQKLAQNGLRVGLVSGQIPPALAHLMQLDDKPAPTSANEGAGVEGLDSEPRVLRRHLQARAGRRSEVITSSEYEELPVLLCDSGHPGGRTYAKAQGVFAVTAWPEPDGRVRLELIPELHYGEARQRWVGGEGSLRMEAGRERRTFDDLLIPATLGPGHMVVLSSLPSRPGSIGHSFFTLTESGKLEQKLVVIRIAQTQHDDLFAAGEPLPLDRVE
ncbi:MAG: hypothetical protein HUU20_14145 [Pirellulales bacterium]|nr:hypothetical protein [Pirellulales bacterium]